MRAWGEALNAGDDKTAARQFAAETLVVQGDSAVALRHFEEVLRFNEALSYSGTIVRFTTQSPIVTAVF